MSRHSEERVCTLNKQRVDHGGRRHAHCAASAASPPAKRCVCWCLHTHARRLPHRPLQRALQTSMLSPVLRMQRTACGACFVRHRLVGAWSNPASVCCRCGQPNCWGLYRSLAVLGAFYESCVAQQWQLQLHQLGILAQTCSWPSARALEQARQISERMPVILPHTKTAWVTGPHRGLAELWPSEHSTPLLPPPIRALLSALTNTSLAAERSTCAATPSCVAAAAWTP